MGLTKKHFKAIADILKSSETKEEITNRLINYFGNENAQFDENRFREALKN